VRAAFSLVIGFALALAIGPFASAQEPGGQRLDQRLDKVTFATNWLAEAEHGGFYQALADGTYAKYGLDVTILQGGPQTNNRLLLAAGKIEFNLAANLIQSFDAAAQNIPIVAVASMFQKDPFILMSHPGNGFDHIEDLPKATAYIGKDAFVSVYQWLKTAYGFRDDKVQPYTFNAAPFIRDKDSIQQGYATSEPFEVARQGGFKPNVFLLADYGYDSYSTLIETRRDLIDKKSRSRAALRRRLDHRLDELHLWRQRQGQCADQARQPGHQRRSSRLFCR
jgi:NitT/TauT family transport system substrate-binding protein